MATELKLRRFPAIDNSTFTGAEGEPIWTTDTKELVIHDGVTVGGNPVIKGASGNFTTVDSKTVTVVDGLIISIV